MTDITEYERGRGDEFDDVVAKLEDIASRSHDSHGVTARLILNTIKSRDHRHSGDFLYVREGRPMHGDWAAGYEAAMEDVLWACGVGVGIGAAIDKRTLIDRINVAKVVASREPR
jgi:hypothetical protein